VVNVIAFAAASSVHTTVISAILSRARLGGMNVLALVLCLVVTIVAFVLMFPLLSLTNVVGLSHGGRISTLRRAGRLVTRYAVTRQAVRDGTDEPEEQHEEAPAPAPGSATASLRYRMINLPAEVFSRPEVSHPRVQSATPTGGPLRVPVLEPVVARVSVDYSNSSVAQPDPAHDLAGGPMGAPTVSTPSVSPSTRALRDNEHVIEGNVVEESPANLRRIETYDVHDSHTEVRSDGVGPRIYDPATKSTVLVVGDPDQMEGPRA
ncbi:hypothetical protein, partial [Oryzihumus sp.]|uniref:hypothetical protein n=1 Tax=Oryzihumus sp. TaxID=1968903 RepID=UPI002ED9DF6B